MRVPMQSNNHDLPTFTPLATHSQVDELQSDEDSDLEDNGFTIRDPLDVPTACAITTGDLHHLIHTGHIDLNPPYQRDVVWTEAKQVALIDSIFKNMYVPPILFAVATCPETGEPSRVCVDGKQRLTSIQKFIDGLICHQDQVTRKKYWFVCADSNKRRKELVPERFRKIFLEKSITCVEYAKIQPHVERELFQRVQNGVALTPAEKLQALSSEWVEWINVLQRKYVTEADGFVNANMSWDISRGRDFDCIARTLFAVYHLPAKTMPGNDRLHKWLKDSAPPPKKFKLFMNRVFDAFVHISSNNGLNQAFTEINARVAPVEFIFIGILLATTSKLADEARAAHIKTLREFVRNRHSGAIRNNTFVWNTCWEFLDGIKVAGGWSIPGNESYRSSRRGKRKRGQRSDDSDDSDYYDGK